VNEKIESNTEKISRRVTLLDIYSRHIEIMFLKLILFLAYIVILFILARLLEAIEWIEVGNLSRRLLDPMTMSVIKLKALLDQRGINYEGAIEKQELAELVESSG
jgi:E3 ubiquitin-protein ligase RNF103